MTALELLTERLILRAPGAADVDATPGFFGSDRARFHGGSLSAKDGWRRFAAFVGRWTRRGVRPLAMQDRVSRATAGLVGPAHLPAHLVEHRVQHPEPEMIRLPTNAAHEGRGLSRAGGVAIPAWLLGTPRWASMVSRIDRDDHASRALAERLGAVRDPAAAAPEPGCDADRQRTGAVA